MSFRRLRLLNTSGETAPPFAIAEVADAVPVTDAVEGGTEDADSVLEVRKPTGTGRVVAVGPAQIEDDRYGKGFTGDCFVRFTGSDPSPGDTLYATSGSWALSSSGTGTGVTVAGDVRDLGAYKIVRVEIGGGGESDNHGFCKATSSFSSGTATVTPTAYRPTEGSQTPSSLSNANSLEGTTDDILAVAKIDDEWEIVYVLSAAGSGGSGALRTAIAKLSAALDDGDSSASITDVRLTAAGTNPSPTTAANTNSEAGAKNQLVLIRETATDTWEVVQVLLSYIYPCWITSGASVASESGGDITANTVTVYLDTLGATAADREAGATSFTAYWDDPFDPVSITAGYGRRGYCCFTALGTLDLMFASCSEKVFTP